MGGFSIGKCNLSFVLTFFSRYFSVSLLPFTTRRHFSASIYNEGPSKMPSHLLLPLSLTPAPIGSVADKGPGGPKGLGAGVTAPDSSLPYFNERNKKLLSYRSPDYLGFLFYCVFVCG